MVRIALAQINQTVGDIDGNSIRILDAIRKAREQGAQVLALPELAITGYPPEDLLRKKSFVDANRRALDELAAETHDSLVVIGFVDQEDDSLFNAAALCHGGRVISAYRKQRLPNYGVFDERRYFEPGLKHTLVETNAGVIGVCVCEDVWFADGPAVTQGDAGAQVVININASPFHKNKLAERATMLGERARRAATSIAY
ncbi:MAG TPA: nitrilase-related carbon-nitrogen hydrolase, partial [Thermomicrobiales bacterium]|nr:nitrilase-related carbon-nitrogen hydrolase [Thermomicrobiales bacterium]